MYKAPPSPHHWIGTLVRLDAQAGKWFQILTCFWFTADSSGYSKSANFSVAFMHARQRWVHVRTVLYTVFYIATLPIHTYEYQEYVDSRGCAGVPQGGISIFCGWIMHPMASRLWEVVQPSFHSYSMYACIGAFTFLTDLHIARFVLH